MPAQDEPTDPLILRRASQLRAVRSPVRLQLLRILRGAGSASAPELAERLGRSSESLYYHLSALVRAGYLVVEPGRPKRYRFPARETLIDQTRRSPAFLRELAHLYRAVLRRAEREVLRGLELDRRRPPDEPRRSGALQLDVRLSAAGLRRFRERAFELLEALEQDQDPDGEPLSVTLCFAPRPDDREA